MMELWLFLVRAGVLIALTDLAVLALLLALAGESGDEL